MRTKQIFTMLAGFAALTLTGAAAQADYAVVVGVDKYEITGHNLRGCVNDASLMAEKLKMYHFDNILLLKDEEATQAHILKALKDAPKDPNQRFVFFFAGHGREQEGCLVTRDSLASARLRDLDRDVLYRAVKAIPAKSRAIILDSCFSGAMSRALGKGRARYLPLAPPHGAGGSKGFGPSEPSDAGDSKEWIIKKVNAQDDNQNVGGGSDICYYTAAQGNQQSNEADFDSGPHGVFTYYLTKKLDGAMKRWGDLNAEVSGDVSLFALDALKAEQTPTLSSKFSKIGLFGGLADGPVVPAQDHKNLWDIFNGKNVDHRMVELKMEIDPDFAPKPGQRGIDTKTQIFFAAHCGAAGYLIILEYGTSGLIRLHYPAGSDADACKVTAGQDVFIPEPNAEGKPQRFCNDSAGEEQIRAILFTSEDQARAFLKPFSKRDSSGKSEPVPMRSLKKAASKDFVTVEAALAPFYTSDLHLDVMDANDSDR